MRATALGKLLPMTRVECASPHCSVIFEPKNGWIFPGILSNGEVHLFFFCTDICFLETMPIQHCVRA